MTDKSKVEIRQIVLARSIQVIKPSGTVGYLPEIVREIQGRYRFLSAPKDEDLAANPPKGAEFRHGRFMTPDGRTIIVDRLTLFNDGVVADSSTSTDDTDLFLDTLVQWAKSTIPRAETVGPTYYLSQLEIRMDPPLETYAPSFRPIGEKISARLSSYGIHCPRYEVTALNLYFDQLGKVGPQPGVFSIDRRLNIPYSENVWFAQAPLKTADHIELLRELQPL